MAYELKALREQLGDVTADLNTLASTVEKDNRPMTDDEITRFDSLDNQRDDLNTKIATAERIERSRGVNLPTRKGLVSSKGSKRVTANDKRNAFRGWVLGERASREWQELAEENGYRNDRNTMMRSGAADFASVISRTNNQDLSESGHGQELTDGDVFVGLFERLKRFGNVRKVSRDLVTANGNPVHYAYSDDTSNTASIVGENTAPTSVPVTYSTVPLTAFTYRSGIYVISYELISDAMTDLIADLSDNLVRRLGRRMNTDWTTGDGSGKPTGFVYAASAGVTGGNDNGFTYAELNKLLHSVDPDYRDKDDGKVCLMMNDATLAFMERNFHDNNGRPIFLGPQSYGNVSDPSPLSIAVSGQRYPIVVNQAMPDIGANASPVAFGWFGGYVTRIVAETRIDVLRERFADQAAIGIQAYARADGNLVDTNAIKLLTLPSGGAGTYSIAGSVQGLSWSEKK